MPPSPIQLQWRGELVERVSRDQFTFAWGYHVPTIIEQIQHDALDQAVPLQSLLLA
jgi:hypothetical protein